jgi:hypothetical protein
MTIRLITYNGHTDSISGWAAKIGISRNCIYTRLERGWTVEEAVANKRMRHRYARKVKIKPSAAPSKATSNPLLAELKRMDLMLQREITRNLRQFIRDFEAIMTRGVARDFSKSPFDRSILVARDLPEIGNS